MNTLQKLLKQDAISLLWTGNNGWLIHCKDKLVAFDLDLFNHERISKCNLDMEVLCKKLDLLMITHEHEDHFNAQTCKMLVENSKCKFVIPQSCEVKARALGMKFERLILVKPEEKHSICGIDILCTRAVHGHINGAVCAEATMLDCGYIIDIEGKTLYQPGDTLLLEQHYSMPKIDVLFLSTTEHNTWIDNSVKLVNLINPDYILPQHHSTYVEEFDNKFWSHGFVNEVYEKLSGKHKNCYKILTQDDIFVL